MSNPYHICHAERCDICSHEFTAGDKVYDAKTKQGPWGTLCSTCFQMHGVGLGTGLGQEYAHGNERKLRG